MPWSRHWLGRRRWVWREVPGRPATGGPMSVLRVVYANGTTVDHIRSAGWSMWCVNGNQYAVAAGSVRTVLVNADAAIVHQVGRSS